MCTEIIIKEGGVWLEKMCRLHRSPLGGCSLARLPAAVHRTSTIWSFTLSFVNPWQARDNTQQGRGADSSLHCGHISDTLKHNTLCSFSACDSKPSKLNFWASQAHSNTASLKGIVHPKMKIIHSPACRSKSDFLLILEMTWGWLN